MTLPCPVCGTRMPGTHRVCRACTGRVLRDLADVPSLALHLDIAIARQARIGQRGAGHSTETALPWDERAREAANVLKSALVGWYRELAQHAQAVQGPVCRACEHPSCERVDLTRAPEDTLPALARWLIRHRGRLLGHRAAAEAVDEIRAAVSQARRAIDRVPDRIYAGPCNQCGTDLLAQPGRAVVVCRECELEYDIDDRQEWMRGQVEGLLGSASWVAAVATTLGVKVSASLIRLWAKRGRISARGYAPPLTPDGEPRALYRVGDVLAAARQRNVGPAR